jgi:hypothetical protein
VESDEQPPGRRMPDQSPQTNEPPPTSPPPQTGQAPQAPLPSRRAHRTRSVLLVVGIALGFVLLLGGTVAIFLYNKATAIDRSTPVVSASSFLRAVFVDGDPAQVGLYTCSAWPADQAMSDTKALADPETHVSWDTFSVVDQSDSRAVLRARLRFRYEGEVAPSGEKTWEIRLADERGWRVCAVAPAE